MDSIAEQIEDVVSTIEGVVIGASDQEVTEISRLCPDRLPEGYLQFLRLAGRSPGILFRGSDARIGTISSNVRWLRRQRGIDEVAKRIPPDAFPFVVHQGYTCFYFCATLGDRSAIFRVLGG